MLAVSILVSVFITSFISGVIGMGGGSILMGVYLAFLPVEAAMILHGGTQLTANGSRAFFLRKNIRWELLPSYFIGILPVLIVFYVFKFVPSKGLIYLLLGSFPFVSMFLRQTNILYLTIEKAFHAFLCGVFITIVQLTAGASGVVLTEFYIHSRLNRKEIVGTESITQSTAHLCKLLYFVAVMPSWEQMSSIPWFVYPLIVIVSIWGTFLGKKILVRLTDNSFKKFAKVLIRSVAVYFFFKGLREFGWF